MVLLSNLQGTEVVGLWVWCLGAGVAVDRHHISNVIVIIIGPPKQPSLPRNLELLKTNMNNGHKESKWQV
jgi:hypothetical protein